MKPKRIQRKRVSGWRKPENTVNVGRPSKYGNPYKVRKLKNRTEVLFDSNDHIVKLFHRRDYGDDFHKEALEYAVMRFREYVWSMSAETREAYLSPLRGKDLMCWCAEGSPCHGDVLLYMANSKVCEKCTGYHNNDGELCVICGADKKHKELMEKLK